MYDLRIYFRIILLSLSLSRQTATPPLSFSSSRKSVAIASNDHRATDPRRVSFRSVRFLCFDGTNSPTTIMRSSRRMRIQEGQNDRIGKSVRSSRRVRIQEGQNDRIGKSVRSSKRVRIEKDQIHWIGKRVRSSNRVATEEGQNDWIGKSVGIKEAQNDFISRLPDSVLVEIISHLPTVDAVKMASFPRFRNLWTDIRCLSFDQCAFHDHNSYNYVPLDGPIYVERFLNLVRRVLILHQRTIIDEFHLKFSFNLYHVFITDPPNSDYASKEKRMASELTTWIDFSLKKQVKVLNIDLVGCNFPELEASYELPNSVLTNNCLIELSLGACGIKEKECIQMMSLTKLSLKEIKLSDEIMGAIFQGCSVLEELFLCGCPGLRKLKLTNHNIKRLKILFGVNNDVENTTLEISCPNVKSLELVGSIELAHLNISSSFSDASLYLGFRLKWENTTYEKLLALLLKLAEANAFIPCAWTILVFTIWALLEVQIPVSFWKFVEARLVLTKWHLIGICSILKSSKCLERLTFYIASENRYKFPTEAPNGMDGYDFDAKDYLKSQNGSAVCLMGCLKTVTIYGHVTEPYVFELIEFLLENALVLERMVISTERTLQPIHPNDANYSVVYKKDIFNSKELNEFSQKLLSLPKASKSAVIEFCF